MHCGYLWPAGVAGVVIGAGAAMAASPGSRDVAGASNAHMDVVLLVTYVLLALLFSFLCSVAEAVLLSITPSYILGLKQRSPRLAALLRRLKQDRIDQSLAAILTLNTIAHTVGAIGAGAKAADVFGAAWFGVFSAVMTLMILFLSEIIPKTLGAVYWQKLTGVTALFVRALIVILYPLIWISEGLTRLIARRKAAHLFSRDEFIAMAGIGERIGQLDKRESRIIRNLFRFGSLKARDIMTPRTVMQGLRENMTVSEALAADDALPFSRLPIYRKDRDDITGFVLKDDMLLSKFRGQGDVRLESLKREITTVPDDMPLSGLLEYILDHRRHIALVADAFGATVGLVTLEDVVETLLGMEIVDEMDRVEDMQALARQQWEKRARALGLEAYRSPPVSVDTDDSSDPEDLSS